MSTTHDVLAYSVATEAVRKIRSGLPPWNTIFSVETYVTSSRSWPVPDFVLANDDFTVGVEFKPPLQTKREYLTGLGQAVAYTRDFDFGLVVLPTIADDGYPIAQHVAAVLRQGALIGCPVGVLEYDPRALSAREAAFNETHFFTSRSSAPETRASLDNSFYAKWREISAEETFCFLSLSYDAMRSPDPSLGTIRDRAFDALWLQIQSGRLHSWAGDVRFWSDTPSTKTGVFKNYRNFIRHVDWCEASGNLTADGLSALQIGTLYGPNSRPFIDTIARALLLAGKHLILFNAISEYQDARGAIENEQQWLLALEVYLEEKGLLKRNPERAAAAVAGSRRQFLKAEKQIWRVLDLIVPNGARAFHKHRGLIFNWSRITDLVQR